ncbi:PREDICTED: mitochondrial fission regulator 1 isoform X1 [Cyprinodon variegatus]|uniref:Mitochondrial fission regulator n=2 Tax=Cyprinodon variegatus TaxID=28743 RepID=A0A3Q2D979_CYPVA|nr:PREDICTED: mitochondrial fission regulator 1 isoform X1 [Cyprinodon variegatus]
MNRGHARTDMDLAFGSAKPYGSSRSLVRRIASNLPIKPCPRVHFQLHPYAEEPGALGVRRQTNMVASLADISLMDEDDEDDEGYLGRSRRGIPSGFMFRAQQPQPWRRPLSRRRSLPGLYEGPPDPQGPTFANDEAIQKINALETELAKLRAQIAQIVMAQEKTALSAAASGAPTPSGNLPPPPPPPAPPPPPPAPALQRTFSAIELIKERRGRKKDEQMVEVSRPAEIPSMLDILKDIDKVKLRSVKSRLEQAVGKMKPKEPSDPAGLIAEALKRKFAHRFRKNSGQEGSDKEDLKVAVPEAKPQTETPLFGQHMLKPTGKKRFL